MSQKNVIDAGSGKRKKMKKADRVIQAGGEEVLLSNYVKRFLPHEHDFGNRKLLDQQMLEIVREEGTIMKKGRIDTNAFFYEHPESYDNHHFTRVDKLVTELFIGCKGYFDSVAYNLNLARYKLYIADVPGFHNVEMAVLTFPSNLHPANMLERSIFYNETTDLFPMDADELGLHVLFKKEKNDKGYRKGLFVPFARPEDLVLQELKDKHHLFNVFYYPSNYVIGKEMMIYGYGNVYSFFSHLKLGFTEAIKSRGFK